MGKYLSILTLFVCITANADTFGLINVSVADMKLEADYESATDSQALLGTPVIITDSTGYWYYIETPDKYHGWVSRMQVTPISESRLEEWKKADRVVVAGYFAVITAEADGGSPVIGDAVMGNILETEGTFDGEKPFTPVVCPDGRKGFVPTETILPFGQWASTVTPTPEGLIAAARKFLGFPYLWGGLSPKGLDCSGLVRMSCWMNGLILPRNASMQTDEGERVKFEDLRAGDLIMFGSITPQNPTPRISHVGIYIGEGRFIHASLIVRINSLDPVQPDFYSSKQFVGACRIIGHEGEGNIVKICEHPLYF